MTIGRRIGEEALEQQIARSFRAVCESDECRCVDVGFTS